VLASFSSQAKVTLHELCKVMGLPGKPNGISGADVEKFYLDGRIREIAEYCESDVVNTYRVWLRYELFRGRLSEPEFHASEACLVDFLKARASAKPHLSDLMHPSLLGLILNKA
jgi:predicted PolB exonuclease-like 3'-5' exonuclease